jgi:signal transduction histidine kinase
MVGLAGEIRQIISNLVMNAIDAAPLGGRLVLKVMAANSWNGTGGRGIRIIVADSGSGILACDRKRIFDAFWTTKKSTGTGLGLWVTRSIVEKAGGTIRVRSRVEPGRSGTVFSVFLPAKSQMAESMSQGR